MAHEQPHDRLLKETLSHLPDAVLFFRKFLPAHIAGSLDYRTLKLENTTFLNDAGRQTYSDLVFSCRWKKSRRRVSLLFLLEHKSSPVKRPHLQIEGYLSEGYQAQGKEQHEGAAHEKLVPIIPLLLYHGAEAWAPGDYEDYFDLPDPSLAEFLPSFRLLLIDVGKYSDEEIIALGARFLASMMLVFKHKNDKEYVLSNIGKVFIFVGWKGSPELLARYFRAMLLYLFRAFSFQKEELDRIVQDLPKTTQPMFESTYDMLIKEGEIKGEAIGLQKGIQKGIQKGEAIGERKRSLENVLDGIVQMPALGDADIARFARLPEAFVAAMRKCFLQNDLPKAEQTAIGLFSDLPDFSDDDVKKIKATVKSAWEGRDNH